MDRLYSINSPNGIGYNNKDLLELEKKKDDYYQFYIKNESESELESYSDAETDSEWYNYIFETKPGICCNCNKNLSIESNNTKIKYKLLYPNESLFIFTSRKANQYWYVYYHYCTECLNQGLYNWFINNPENKYPYLRYDGGLFINSINNINLNQAIPKKNYPRIYRCDYYLSSGYNYLEDDSIELSCDKRKKCRKKLISYELNDILTEYDNAF